MRRALLGSAVLCLLVACSAAGTDPSSVETASNASFSLSASLVSSKPAHGGARVDAPAVESTMAAAAADAACTPSMRINVPPGLVIPSVAINHVFWGSYWSGSGTAEKTHYDTAWNTIGNDAAFYARLAEYSTSTLAITTGSWTGSTLANASLASGTTVTEDQIQAELKAEITAGTVPPRSNSRLYVVMLPPGVTSQFDQQNSFAGHHRSFADASGNPVYYAVITYNADVNYNDPLISHEISEAITDPDLATGWMDSGGEEIGDVCRGNYAPLDGFTIEKIWSMQACACVGAGTAPPPGPIVDGDFEQPTLVGWTTVGPTAVSSTAHGGTGAALVGSRSAFNGDASIAQTFTAPANGGTLSFWYDVLCNDTVQYDWATATLKDNTAGTTATVLPKTCTNAAGAWKQATATVIGGHSYTLTLVSHDDGASGDPTYTLYDDVTISASAPPPPSPIVNGDFETGNLSGWTPAGSAAISTTTVHGGHDAALLGLVGKQTSGDSSVAQTFTAPSTTSALSFWYRVVCKDTVQYDWATATLKDNTTGTTTTPLAKKCSNTGSWSQVSAALAPGHSYTLKVVSHDDNNPGDETYVYVDDVTVK